MRSAAARRGTNSGYLASDLARQAPSVELRRSRERSSGTGRSVAESRSAGVSRAKTVTRERPASGPSRDRSSVAPLVRAPELPKPPVRLRYVLLLALLAAGGFWLEPRARAAWKVHALATALADYGACMVGPTGPGLLRSHQLDEFRRLVRRRLVTSALTDAPFERCAVPAAALSAGPGAVAAHRAKAWSFTEYGGNPRPEHSLSDLSVTPDVVAREARAAWPFVRGYAELVKPSLGAKEASHPIAAPAPAGGRGLPVGRAFYRGTRVEHDGIVLAHGQGANLGVFRSSDGGATWKAVPTSEARDLAERCPAGDGRAFVVKPESGATTLLVSLAAGQESVAVPLASAKESLLAMACDERGLVAVIRGEGSERALLRQCGFAAPCTPMAEPVLSGNVGLEFPLDIARVAGTTVVALSMGNVVRVASSRDGATWTPLSVAFDGAENPLSGPRMPTRLLAIGKRLLLHGGSPRSNDGYGLLVSEDQGASFRGR